MEYMEINRKSLEEAPTGIYAIIKIEDQFRDTVKPGVIFTLKQVKGFEQTKDQNALFPYYMIYITEDGSVKLSYHHIKKILDYYQKLCSGQKEVLVELVNEFNEETKDGRDMGQFSKLLEASIGNILGKKDEAGVTSLFTKGGTSMVKNTFSGLEEFELVTFLIIK